jgi:glycosyltransferase involved in cell wall biosynthesis
VDVKVLVVHNRYRSAQPSGEDRVVDQEVALLRDAGHEVGLFERRSDDIADMSMLAKAAVPLQVPWNFAVRRTLGERLRAERPDVVHIHNTFPLLSPAVVAACADAAIPAVATLHNYGPICVPGTLFRDGQICTDCVGTEPLPALRHGCYRGSTAATLPTAAAAMVKRRRWWSAVARFFCVSQAQRHMFVQAGLPAQRMAVKYNFVGDPGLRRDEPGQHLLFLGRLAEEKGVRLLMAAWDRIRADGGMGLPLLIAGAGPLRDEVAQWAHDRHDVRYVGLQTRTECWELVARAVALVAPSAWLEAFGLVVVEAMAVGVPSVAAGHGAFLELIDDGVNGLLHSPGDADSLADSLRRVPATSSAMGSAARRTYEREFTPQVGLERLVTGYAAAVSGAVECEPV